MYLDLVMDESFGASVRIGLEQALRGDLLDGEEAFDSLERRIGVPPRVDKSPRETDLPPRAAPSGMLLPEMATPERRHRKSLRAPLDREVVAPLFEDLAPTAPGDASIPEIVLRNRRNRAQERVLEALISRGSAEVPDDLLKEARRMVRRWAAAGFVDGFKEAEDFEIRCARDHDLVVAQEAGDMELVLEVYEREYRRQVREQFGKIELRGIQTAHRVSMELDRVYVPLHLEPRPEEAQDESGKVMLLLARQRVPVLEVLREQRHLLIVGAPGSGKSTLIGDLATRAAAGHLQEVSQDSLPFVVTVRSLKKPSLNPSGIAEHVSCPTAVVQRAFQQKRALVFVDGLDEAPQGLRERLVEALQKSIQRQPALIVTSRPAGPPGEIEKSLPGLKPYQLADLTREEVDSFIEKWCLAAEISVHSEHTETEKEATKAAEDLKRRLSLSYAVQKLAVTPLLTTILCVVHRFLGRTIPEHRVTLYQKCTDALLYEWDRAKFPEGAAIGNLGADAKRRLLMGVARIIHERHAAEIEEKEVVQHFAKRLPDLGSPASDAKSIVQEIRDRSGILVERRPGYFAFSHLTFQEYLCALDFAESKSLRDLASHFNEAWWHEVIVLAAGAPGGSGGEMARFLLSRRNLRADLLAAQCLETDTAMPLKIRERIQSKLQKLIPPRDFTTVSSLVGLGIWAAPLLMKALPKQDPEATINILLALNRIDFAPAIPVIAQCANDKRPSGLRYSRPRNRQVSIGGFAVFVLGGKIASIGIAKGAFKEALEQISLPEAESILTALEINSYIEAVRITKEFLSLKRRSAPEASA